MTTEAGEETPQTEVAASQAPPQTAPSPYSKPCSLCSTPRDVLVRCQIDESGKWVFVCVGKCWKRVSGGKIDGDKEHPMYRYGGMWKNKHDAVSAKKKKKKKSQPATQQEKPNDDEQDQPEQATTSDEELLTKDQ